ncbi:MAG: hypothetical protein IPG05_14320 [Gemmatimonadetes bacterium]|nr:hypothetical protein [Gemmatimonadota bacterium]
MLLPMMRRHGIGMRIVVNEEFDDNPVVHAIARRAPTPATATSSSSWTPEQKGFGAWRSPAIPRTT